MKSDVSLKSTATTKETTCFHCGEECNGENIIVGDHRFCCNGCSTVFQLLNNTGLCSYYDLNSTPGIKQRIEQRKDKFSFLDDAAIAAKLVRFSDEKHTHILLHLPQIHCSSCLYLLENLHSLDKAIISAKVDFLKKEIALVFDQRNTSLRKVVELLASVGYEPYLSLGDLNQKSVVPAKQHLYQLGVAGFCFANIMLLSFPEYLGLRSTDNQIQQFFSYVSLLLSLPVLLFSAVPFFHSGLSALRQRHLNIDAPIAIAILVTFARSAYDILSGTGTGYLDSMSGIVFFMLTGRWLQDRSFRQLSFDRDFTSYFPVAVTVIKEGITSPKSLPDVKIGDTLIIHNEELIPADGILTKGKAFIDYSFVTGEAMPVSRQVGEMIYAGGKQQGSSFEMLLIKEVSQSYLTRLWSNNELRQQPSARLSFVHRISQYFSYVVLMIAISAGIYWSVYDPARILNVVTSVMIIACPCALLLSNSFTNGYILRILARNRFYLRDAQVIENIAATNHIVFDKTGTLTDPELSETCYTGTPLTVNQEAAVIALTSQSMHPISKAINSYFFRKTLLQISGFREKAGHGIEGWADTRFFALGSREFVTGTSEGNDKGGVYLAVDGQLHGVFNITNKFRPGLPPLINKLKSLHTLSVVSGDNKAEESRLRHLFGQDASLLFFQSPENKLKYIASLEDSGNRTMMIGDGLNDAGALRRSSVGIAVSKDCNNFTPASDAILDATHLSKLHQFIKLCRNNKIIVKGCFAASVVYNLVGLSMAVQGDLSPLVAAVLMPASSLSILLISYVSATISASRLKLKT